MKLNQIKPAKGSRKVGKRLGQGLGTGNGKTAGRGQKGQKSRSGYSKGSSWEGGRSRLVMRLPKRGFNNVGLTYQVVNLKDLNMFEAGATVDVAALNAKGLVKSRRKPVKLLGDGEVTVKNLTVDVHASSANAIKAVEAVGGRVNVPAKVVPAKPQAEAAKEGN
jgi:large subunit ribosomal protein L15